MSGITAYLPASLRRRGRAGLLRDESEFQPGGDRDAGAARRRRRRRLRRRTVARARGRHSARQRSCSPASARPRTSSRLRSSTAFSASTSNPSRSLSFSPPSPPARVAAPTFRSASIRTSMRRPTPRSRPARPRTNSAFRSAARARFTPAPPSSTACASSASTCISAARSPSSIRSATHSRCSRSSSACCARDGHTHQHVDLGGGLGIPYREDNEPPPDPAAYARVVKRATRGLGCRLIFEPGRLIVGNAGILVTRVLYLKRGEAKTFVIVDAGMNDLVRPTLYDAITTSGRCVRRPAGAPRIFADVVGPVCESGDFLALDRSLVRTAARRSSRRHERRRLWRGAGRNLQYPPAGPRSPCPHMANGLWCGRGVTAEELIALDRMPAWL